MIALDPHQLAGWINALWWPFVRVLAFFYSAPVLGSPQVPRKVRIGLALAVALVVRPILSGHVPDALGPWPVFLGLTVQQLLIGIMIGFAARIVFAAVNFAGGFIGLEMGLGFAALIDPKNGVNVPTLSSFLGLFATLIFFAMNGHLLLIAALARSFTIAPPGTALHFVTASWFTFAQWGGEIFLLGVVMALPIVTMLVAVNLALGVLAKIAPQLNIFVVGFPVLLLLGMVGLYLSAPALGRAMVTAFDWALRVTSGAMSNTVMNGAAYG